MADQLDDELLQVHIRDMSAGQFSYPHAGDKIVMPDNAGAQLFDIEIDRISQRTKRRGYTLKANAVGGAAIKGLIGFTPSGASGLLLRERGGTIQSWDGAAATWTDRKTGLTDPSDFTEFVAAKDRIFRMSQTDNIWSSSDGTTWSDEGNTNTDVPLGKIGVWTANQRFLVFNTDADPNLGWYSSAGDPQTFDRSTNAAKFGPKNDTGVIAALEFTDNEIMVWTKDQMFAWNIQDTTPSNWIQTKIADIGCVAARTARQVGQDALFLSQDGVRSVIQSAQDKKRGDSLPLSFPIQDWIDRINWTYAHKAIAYVWEDKYILSVPVDLATHNTHAFVWSRRAFEANQGRGGWVIWTNWAMNAYTIQSFGTKDKLYGGEASAASKVYQLRSKTPSENTTNDNGTAIVFDETGKRLDFGIPNIDKSFQTLEVEALAKDGGTLYVYAQVDGNGFTLLGTITQSAGLPQLPIALPFSLGGSNKVRGIFDLSVLDRGREIQIQITESTLDAETELLGYSVTAFVENYEWNTR